ncbi:lytic transglycosylase domain-containing protein [Streptomyces sp. Vc74B-19]|uniref:lytic transglycosylase domain-containing protein n=1 Tax=unclassified Streptomyces TaxID=2593676 RepID=UPI001BFC14B6|nr:MULTISPECIES: lytic transglycosylase domain-containing protein [unclassified Streptomyces]MBT3161582.1 lytic transglycosylase domain-containing protein [Streptomyces sp. Vc74B-19]
MSVRRSRRRYSGRARRGLRTTVLAVAAMTALTASQAPGLVRDAEKARAEPAGDGAEPSAVGDPYAELAPPGDGSYHTELPPLRTAKATTSAPPVLGREVRAQSGIPATVLRAYRAAETSVARTDPGCRLPWELLAAIGKVESGQARGGAVDRNGTTLGRITGPPLDGRGFALIRDTDGGAHDGDTVYDRAVGPMQFLPSTWARWGTDGNGDGRADPNNIFDAALAAGHYLCAGDRNLGRPADLDRAVLSYNHSRSYLRLVRYWLAFYSHGVHAVPDGKGVVPRSPGAGGDTPATKPVDGGNGGGGVVIGPQPSPPGGTGPSPRPSPSAPGSPDPSAPTSPSPGPSTSPSDTPTEPPTSQEPTEPPGESPTGTPEPSPDPTTPDPCSSESATPDPSPTPQDPDAPCPTPTPTATSSER